MHIIEQILGLQKYSTYEMNILVVLKMLGACRAIFKIIREIYRLCLKILMKMFLLITLE
jgi:hypothetical protein